MMLRVVPCDWSDCPLDAFGTGEDSLTLFQRFYTQIWVAGCRTTLVSIFWCETASKASKCCVHLLRHSLTPHARKEGYQSFPAVLQALMIWWDDQHHMQSCEATHLDSADIWLKLGWWLSHDRLMTFIILHIPVGGCWLQKWYPHWLMYQHQPT